MLPGCEAASVPGLAPLPVASSTPQAPSGARAPPLYEALRNTARHARPPSVPVSARVAPGVLPDVWEQEGDSEEVVI